MPWAWDSFSTYQLQLEDLLRLIQAFQAVNGSNCVWIPRQLTELERVNIEDLRWGISNSDNDYVVGGGLEGIPAVRTLQYSWVGSLLDSMSMGDSIVKDGGLLGISSSSSITQSDHVPRIVTTRKSAPEGTVELYKIEVPENTLSRDANKETEPVSRIVCDKNK
ncbi:uncharacterized protein BDR25DRAFT_308455 [Lindgomyces ingoldianus]|uniref:Uncharacterized protein n=1 Tax=Lindgomyces ingoldianus TaxID=673940 RepID=A0ACB6RFL3_9PLEO|nr:uncharacterized protein BDR25DRAFT_308455 [Lindgomyces ingoldianus]KAF2477548.1 hypothetical protein BDR25DRAFT_308455 [Lindgomyces ingoldianus]